VTLLVHEQGVVSVEVALFVLREDLRVLLCLNVVLASRYLLTVDLLAGVKDAVVLSLGWETEAELALKHPRAVGATMVCCCPANLGD